MAPPSSTSTAAAVLKMAQASFTALLAQMSVLQAQISLLEQLHRSTNDSSQPDSRFAHISSINTLPTTLPVPSVTVTCKCGNNIDADEHHDKFIRINNLPPRKKCHVCCTAAKLAKTKAPTACIAAKNQNKTKVIPRHRPNHTPCALPFRRAPS